MGVVIAASVLGEVSVLNTRINHQFGPEFLSVSVPGLSKLGSRVSDWLLSGSRVITDLIRESAAHLGWLTYLRDGPERRQLAPWLYMDAL